MSQINDSKPDRLEALWGHLGNMSPEQIREAIRRSRADRKIRKEKASETKSTKTKSDSARVKLKKLAADPAMLAKLLKELEDGS